MKVTEEKLIKSSFKVFGWAFAGAIAAWCVFYVADFILQRVTNIHLYHQGELLMDAVHRPTDSLVHGYLLFFWLFAIGAIVGLIFGVIRVARQK